MSFDTPVDGHSCTNLAFIDAFRAGIRPDPVLTVAQWADEHRVLSSKASAEPGKWRTSRTPYLKAILEALSPSSAAHEVVFMKGSQIGGSEAGFNWLGYIVHSAPGPTMMVQPTVDLAERVSKQRLAPMIEECPVLRDRIRDSKSRTSGNTLLAKEFPGGMLLLAGANSAAGLRSVPIKNLFLDEIDAYPHDVEGEGSPVELAERRTATFARRKIFKVSSPTYKGASTIEAAFLESDQRYFHVPCPHCSAMQTLKWSGVRWGKLSNGRPDLDSVHYICDGCGDKILEHHKTVMFAAGEWVAANPGARAAGFHLSALYSPLGWYSWADAVEFWCKAQKKPALLKVFINTVLGETFELRGEDTPKWQAVYGRREDYEIGKVPRRAVLLTAACDVQKDRLEVTVVGWSRKEVWVIDHLIFAGETSRPVSTGVWVDLDKLLAQSWQHEGGSLLTINMLAIDSGFNTNRVYEYVRRKSQRQVIPIKGMDTLTMPIGTPKSTEVRSDGKRIRRGVRLWPVGSSVLKADVYGRLKLERPTDEELRRSGYPATYVHFPMLGEEYFMQLAAEQLVLSTSKTGFPRYQWMKTHPNNEALDCLCYNFAAYYALGANRWPEANWVNLEEQLGIKSDTVAHEEKASPAVASKAPTNPSRAKRSSYW